MAEELKRHGITFSLDLNKHPKDATNLSLINAENFKVSEDGASLVADRNLLENEVIKNTLDEYYSKYGDPAYKIINCIPTNDEIVLFVENTKVLQNEEQIVINSGNNEDNLNYSKIINIFRYNEKINTCKIIPILAKDFFYPAKGEYYNANKNVCLVISNKPQFQFFIKNAVNYIEFKDINNLYCGSPYHNYGNAGNLIIYPYETGIILTEEENSYSVQIYTKKDNNTEFDTIYYKTSVGGEIESLLIDTESIKIPKVTVNNYINYYDGKFSGTFTYNVKNELIIAFCEYDSVRNTEFDCGEPMKTINLGYWENNIMEDGTDNWILINNSNLDPKTFPICPEVNIPLMMNDEIISGNSKKGWYHFYIRYKINNYDYTQWFDFGKSFYLDEGKETIIFNYPAKNTTTNLSEDAENNWTHKIYCSTDEDICNKTIKFTLNNLSNLYLNYQIGFICSTKIYNECKITDDIDINNIEFILNYSNCKDYDNTQIIKTYNNYYNVKNIINYNNRLYISNYKTKLNEDIKNNINVKIVNVENENTDIKEVIVNINNENKKITLKDGEITAKELYGVEKLYAYNSKIDKNTKKTGITASNDEITFHTDLYELFIKYDIDVTETSTEYVLEENRNTLESDTLIQIYKVHFLRANGKEKTIIENNNSIFNGESLKFIKEYWCKRQYIYYYEYTELTDISDYTYKYDEDNEKIYCNKMTDNLNVIGRNKDKYDNFSKSVKHIPFPVNITENVEYKAISNEYYIIPDTSKDNELNDKFTLIPKQPYTFYIHYIDKYGQITDGYPIYNNKIIEYENEKYLKIGNAENSITNINNSNIFKRIYYDVDIYCKFSNKIPIGDNKFGSYSLDFESLLFNIITLKNNIVNYFVEYDKLNNYNCGPIGPLDDPNTNYNLKTYFEENDHHIQIDGILLSGAVVNNAIDFYKDYDIDINEISNIFLNNEYNMSYLLFNNIIIPENYVSCFISYEKLNKVQIWEGISNNKKFYTDKLNYRDIISINIYEDNNNNIINKVNYKIANSYKDENFGLSSYLDIEYKDENSNLDYFSNLQYLYKNFINLYLKNNKTLIRITNISNATEIITKTYGFYSYLSAIEIIQPYRINSANILIEYDKINTKLNSIPIEVDRQVNRFQYIPDSSKQINNPPKLYKTNISKITIDNPEAEFYDSYLFLPQDTIDLFKNNALDYDESVLSTYSNYNETNINQTDFIKTIRRSTYIKDESLENGWRTFESEAYQNIQENKGEITRIEGIGDLLLVHTKDSLFQFDKSNLLMTANKNVQLAQGDTFDVGYKEIFTSKNGFGGLQDRDAAIVGEFGYIWYNNDFNKIYQYDAGSLNIISGNIEFLLNKYKPTKCKFVDDKQNKRLIIQFQLKPVIINDKEKTQILNLTYNYYIKSFISFYINENSEPTLINEVYNTKTKFYILENNKIFNEFDKPNAKKLSFIINENYTKIKRLNYIKYKLYKRINSSDEEEFNANLPVEGNALSLINKRRPYSGYKLRVYNDLCSTEELDIQTDYKENINDITKPYYDLGNFTFNYLRDKETNSQIFGNFFIVEFIFEDDEDDEDDVIEFESLEYNINYEEN